MKRNELMENDISNTNSIMKLRENYKENAFVCYEHNDKIIWIEPIGGIRNKKNRRWFFSFIKFLNWDKKEKHIIYNFKNNYNDEKTIFISYTIKHLVLFFNRDFNCNINLLKIIKENSINNNNDLIKYIYKNFVLKIQKNIL